MSEDTGIAAQDETTEVEQQEVIEESSTSEEAEQQPEKETEQPEESPKPKGVQKRISELTANWRNAERDRDYWREMATQKQSVKPEPTQEPARESVKEPPTLEAAGYDEAKYQQAMLEYLNSQVDSRLTEREQKQQAEQKQAQMQQQVRDFYQKGSSVAEDFDEVVSNANGITQAMADTFLALEKGPELAYQLAQNPSELARIASLNPYAQAAEIGRLEVRLSMPKPKSTSAAPPPIKPLSAGGESVSKDPDDMSPEEWLKWRNEQLSKR